MRILLIDDVNRQMDLYVHVLRMRGHTVYHSATNEHAINLLNTGEPFDIIVEDIMRPPGTVFSHAETENGLLTGVHFYKKYIQTSRPNTPHVFFTEYHGTEGLLASQDPKKCVFLSKSRTTPIQFYEVLETLGREEVQLLFDQATMDSSVSTLVISWRDEIKRHLCKHPEKLHSLSPRAFEELVADILTDLGLDVELTKATRDGGVDIYARLKHEVGMFLMLVECKKWSPDNPVGIDVVQRMYGIQQTTRANKSLIVTTSHFSAPAKAEASKHNDLMDLKDYEVLKEWLSRYKS